MLFISGWNNVDRQALGLVGNNGEMRPFCSQQDKGGTKPLKFLGSFNRSVTSQVHATALYLKILARLWTGSAFLQIDKVSFPSYRGGSLCTCFTVATPTLPHFTRRLPTLFELTYLKGVGRVKIEALNVINAHPILLRTIFNQSALCTLYKRLSLKEPKDQVTRKVFHASYHCS